MHQYRAFTCLAFLALPAAVSCRATSPLEELQTEIRESIAHILAEHEGTSAAVALVGPDGYVWTEGFGYVDGALSQPVDADTLFSLQSTTKVFTAIAIMRAVETGRLDLDEPISTWLPGFTIRSRFGGRPEELISLRLLLSHRAGLSAEAPVGNNLSAGTPSFAEHLASIPETWLRYPVGERFAYSNLGIDVAGWVLQQQAGRPFDEVVRDEVLHPLGMERSRFATPDLRNERNRAVGRVAGEDLPPEISFLPSGGLYSSARDLALFLRLMLDRGKPLLGDDAWMTMHEIAAPVSSFQSSGYGLGVILQNAKGRLVASHSGGGFGFGSEVIWIPSLGVGIAALQTTNPSREILDEVKRLFGNRVTELAGRSPLEQDPAFAEPVECLADADAELPRGAWVGRGTAVVTISRKGEFGVLGSGFRRMCPVGGGQLADPDRGLRDSYRVVAGDDGRPVRLVGLNSGVVYDYNDGPDDPHGPDLRRWTALLGTYEYSWYGRSPIPLTLRERNGYLYFDDLRLIETQPGLFVASNGEVLDLRSEPPTWRSVRIRKISDPPTADARNAKVRRALELFALLRDGQEEAFLGQCTSSVQAGLRPPAARIWREQVGAPEPIRAEVDDLGSVTRVLLFVPHADAAYRVEMELDEHARVAGLWFSDGAASTWWHVVGGRASE